jgi:DNA-binding XRE family transcriptional regulator
MTPDDLRAWQAHMEYTYDTASKALGVARSTYATWVNGQREIDLRTALACAAIAANLKPFESKISLSEPSNRCHPYERQEWAHQPCGATTQVRQLVR